MESQSSSSEIDEKCWFCDNPAQHQLLVQQGRTLPSGMLQAPRYQPVCKRHYDLYNEDRPEWRGKNPTKKGTR